MLRGGELKKRIETLMDARGELYGEAADVCVETDDKDFEQIVKEIMAYVR